MSAGESTPTPPVACSIAGSDSGGGAGIAADVATFFAHGVHATFVLTAVTAQDTRAVHGTVVLHPGFVVLQLDAVLGDFAIGATKTGMLATTALVDLVAERAATGVLGPLVVDPVMVASSGASLIEGDAAAAYRRLLGQATVATPNLPEAETLLGRPVESVAAMRDAAKALHELGPSVVLVKGGHLRDGPCIDIAYDGTELVELDGARIDTQNVHGTGCTLSAAITASLALGETPLDAIVAAKAYVASAIATSATWQLGSGAGPVSHLALGAANG